MRVTSLAAGLALLAGACGGGEKKAAEQGAPQQEQAAPAAATGATHDVDMVVEGSSYKFVPAELTIKAGDVVRWHNKSGGPHNVSFWADSIPSGAASVLDASMPDRTGPLQGPMIVEPNAVYQISFAGAPTGEYHYYCLPHLAFKMHGQLKVE